MINLEPDELTRVILRLAPNRTTLTKSQRAYVDVRKAIVTHDLPAGIPLDESYLHSLFPVGRTPLREALKLLAHERFLSWPAHQAPSVTDVSMQDMVYLFETRSLPETNIAVLAAQRVQEANREEMDRLRIAMSEASAKGATYESVEYDYALHAAIARATQNQFLAEASNQLNLQSLRLWYRSQSTHGITSIDKTHSDLVTAICTGDRDLSRQLAQDHVRSSFDRQKSLLDREDLDFGNTA